MRKIVDFRSILGFMCCVFAVCKNPMWLFLFQRITLDFWGVFGDTFQKHLLGVFGDTSLKQLLGAFGDTSLKQLLGAFGDTFLFSERVPKKYNTFNYGFNAVIGTTYTPSGLL